MNSSTKLKDVPGIERMSMFQLLTLAAGVQATPGDERAELERFRAQQTKETERAELERLRAEASQREAAQLAALAACARQEARDFVLGR
jgi:hypothetical protein